MDANKLEQTYQLIEQAAIEGKRCPENGSVGMASGAVGILCRAGRIRVEIFHKNYRVAVILQGPHKGKTTAPLCGARQGPWKVVGTVTLMHGRPVGGQRPDGVGEPSRPKDYSKGA